MNTLTWANDTRKLSRLVPWEINPRQLTEKQAEHLRTSLTKFHFAQPFLISPDNAVYDGHQRLALMLTMSEYGPAYVADVRVSSRPLTHDERRELVVRLHENTGEWDFEGLANLYDVEELGEWGFPEWKIDEFMPEEEPEPEDAEPQISRADELREQWGVEPGQLWRLPSRVEGQEHRLICGDCTDGAAVERVMVGERAEMVWTDPPYGVAVGDKNKFLNSIARSNRVEENLENDTLDEPALAQMLCVAFDGAISKCLSGGAWYVAAPAGPLHVLFGQILKDRGIWRQTIQWVKNNATFSPMGVDYHWQAEPIFYGWLPGAGHRYYGGRKQTTVWNIDRPSKSPEHPTMKPVELVQRAVGNSSRSGEVVYDPFLGSGTTIIAAENLSRQCRAVEISPAYVAVALQRYVDAFGIEPELVS